MAALVRFIERATEKEATSEEVAALASVVGALVQIDRAKHL